MNKVLDIVERFFPQLIAASAEFGTYAKISGLISSLNKPAFSVLEGGYSDELVECVENYLEGWK